MGKKYSGKLLYIMGIDWEWIFQRPQIVAQHLGERYDVTVVFPRSILENVFFWRKRSLVKREGASASGELDWEAASRCSLHLRILWTIPFQEKVSVIGRISAWLNRRVFKDIREFDCVWVGYPLYGRYLPEDYGGKIVYDCMDNHEALYPYRKGVAELLRQEERLVHRCDALIVSGLALWKKMEALAEDDRRKLSLVRNGTDMEIAGLPQSPQRDGDWQIGYFGTIAEWFDYELLLESLRRTKGIEYHLIGPVRLKNCAAHDKIKMEGIVKRENLKDVTKDYACLFMPFIVNDVVKSVDPVKLYEYISLGKCIISVYYEELERFREFVYFYESGEEYQALLEKLMGAGFPPKYTAKQQSSFLRDNSWQERFGRIDEILDRMI